NGRAPRTDDHSTFSMGLITSPSSRPTAARMQRAELTVWLLPAKKREVVDLLTFAALASAWMVISWPLIWRCTSARRQARRSSQSSVPRYEPRTRSGRSRPLVMSTPGVCFSLRSGGRARPDRAGLFDRRLSGAPCVLCSPASTAHYTSFTYYMLCPLEL